MTKRKLPEEPPTPEPAPAPAPLFSPGLTERQQIALAMKLSGESSCLSDPATTPRPSKVVQAGTAIALLPVLKIVHIAVFSSVEEFILVVNDYTPAIV